MKKVDRKEHLSYLDLAETLYNWFNRYRNVVKGPKSVCSLCEKETENFKYCMVKFRDKVAALEDLAEQWYKWKGQDNVHEEKRKYQAGFDSLALQRRLAMKFHGLDVEAIE